MARNEIIEITCDICGTALHAPASKADRTFSVDGQQYTIDLCVTHMAELDSLLAPFTAAARRESGRAARSSVSARPARSVSARSGLKGIREWARANGFPDLSDRGRVPSQVLAAWQSSGAGAGDATGTRGTSRGATKVSAARKRAPRRPRSTAKSASSVSNA